MRCSECDNNFRTVDLPKGAKMVCYHCGHDNGIKQTEKGETDG